MDVFTCLYTLILDNTVTDHTVAPIGNMESSNWSSTSAVSYNGDDCTEGIGVLR